MSKRHKNINPSGCGVYIIQNTDNKNIYVGSSLNCEKRFKNHIRDLKKGIHANNYLQNAFNYHGETKFKFKVLYNCNAEERVKFEFDEIKKIVDKGSGGTLYNIVKNPEMIHQNWYIRKMKQDGYIYVRAVLSFLYLF